MDVVTHSFFPVCPEEDISSPGICVLSFIGKSGDSNTLNGARHIGRQAQMMPMFDSIIVHIEDAISSDGISQCVFHGVWRTYM